MAEIVLLDDPQTVEGLQSLARTMHWMRSMPLPLRRQFGAALVECSDDVQEVVSRMLEVVATAKATPAERQSALMTISDALSLNPEGEWMDAQETTFALRLQKLMEAKHMSQTELADRVGCSQPAISQMLTRNCRPQKKTIFKLAQALGVEARDLWPDLEVADMLDAVTSFQQDDYVMTDAEADALSNTKQPNRPKIRAKSLPVRR